MEVPVRGTSCYQFCYRPEKEMEGEEDEPKHATSLEQSKDQEADDGE